MCCIIYGVWHDAVVIDCSAMRFGTRRPEVFAITTMESRKVNDKIFISGMVIRGWPRQRKSIFDVGLYTRRPLEKFIPGSARTRARAYALTILIAPNCGANGSPLSPSPDFSATEMVLAVPSRPFAKLHRHARTHAHGFQ